jgi:SAGA-associated factor 29
MCRKLKALYEDTIGNSELEEDLLSAMALTANKTITKLAEQAGGHVAVGTKSQSSAINSLDSSLPVWPGLHPLRLCGSIPPLTDWHIPPGHQVCALVSKGKVEEDRWILGCVISFNDDDERKNIYVVEDIMEDVTVTQEASAPERYLLKRVNVLPLPQWCPVPHLKGSYHESGVQVLALYPQTTCFYPAVVHEPPTVDRPGSYQMHFYDDDYPDGRARYQEVAVKFVVGKPKEAKK